jgi:hypothetical protein
VRVTDAAGTGVDDLSRPAVVKRPSLPEGVSRSLHWLLLSCGYGGGKENGYDGIAVLLVRRTGVPSN